VCVCVCVRERVRECVRACPSCPLKFYCKIKTAQILCI